MAERYFLCALLNGGRSSAGRAPDCGSGCRGFEPHRSPFKADNNVIGFFYTESNAQLLPQDFLH